MEKPYGLTMRSIVKNDEGKILVLRRHPKSKTNPHKWELPGGKIEKGEFFDEALIREVKEETNLDVKVGDFCEAVQDDYPHKRTVQLIMYSKDITGEVKISDEHDDWMWASADEIKSLEITSSLEKIIEKRNGEL
ncbi:MAG: NUDIX domain-containing protein [Methanobrevibacter millerae]|uniref:8-oxo-dGTP diphosphatase n=1 Tax=Methanobrevibacter millerae TaxID=230361 RepID=A0A8T3VJF5_9EURY|nr:NUDIX domain-containing protein [Methanobrevibacter millerae]MBE6506226.1 NUDIX domain-containing protein [Methanobrevibacter millerae]